MALALSVVLATMVSAFLLFFAAPSDPALALCPESKCPPERLAQISASLGLDRPLRQQFFEYFSGLFVGRDFTYAGDTVHCSAPCLGFSFLTRQSVNDELFSRFPNTVVLAIMAAIVFVTVGVVTGIAAAVRRGTAADRLIVGASQVLGAIPYYVLALLVALYPVILWHVLPQFSPMSEGFGRFLLGLLAPALILGLVTSASYTRYTRNSMLETLSMDYVRTARSKGIPERTVLFQHGFRAAMSPILTILGLDIAYLLTGTLITEQIFGVDGIGRRTIQAFRSQDLPVIMGSVLMTAVIIVVMNLIVDIGYSLVDPRVRLS
ncbi:MAG: ABC transporter permease [Dermatophilaceae bacterium]|nr:ABC transporter permease [Dermatophilaceae bacterium]NUO91544.1 ABC transporter permease [Dermatophilaceae bacterium]NUQ32267.1 ABC transporter permease [Dermatophilaceae bacterium]NUR16064.1 ABC transporter permease [Dermatophilaceae bacterium]NUR82308.1 ABC transporter permease [Dermatophilaceae bacterium]